MKSLGKWIKEQPWFSAYSNKKPSRTLEVSDVVLVEDKAEIPASVQAKHYWFIAADGPLPLGVIPEANGKAKGTAEFNTCLPSSLEPVLKRIEDRSSEPGAPRYVYNHMFIPGGVSTKTVEFYRNWAASSKYGPGLSYLIFSNRDDMIDAALGFHEQNCWLCSTGTNPVSYVDIGGLRLKLGVELGGGDTVRRVNDLRALSLLATGNDFNSHIGSDLQTLIHVYRRVTTVAVRCQEKYLVDGERWNLDVLKQLLENLPGHASASLNVELCKQFFRYMAWALELVNGFCPDFDFLPPFSQVSPADLLRALSYFDESVLFEDQSEILRSLPGAVLRLCQEEIPPDAPPEVLGHKDDVFAPMVRDNGSSWEVARTIADVLEQYRGFAGQVPDLDDDRYWAPVMCRRGERSIVPLVKSDPDFGSVFRISPLIGEVVLIQVRRKMVVGLVREIIDKESCRVQLYHITLPAVALSAGSKALRATLNVEMRATYVGHIECNFTDLLWKRNTRPKKFLPKGQRGDWCITVDRDYFGFVGVLVHAHQKFVKLIGNVDQSFSRVPRSLLPCLVYRFDQLSLEEIREIVNQGHL